MIRDTMVLAPRGIRDNREAIVIGYQVPEPNILQRSYGLLAIALSDLWIKGHCVPLRHWQHYSFATAAILLAALYRPSVIRFVGFCPWPKVKKSSTIVTTCAGHEALLFSHTDSFSNNNRRNLSYRIVKVYDKCSLFFSFFLGNSRIFAAEFRGADVNTLCQLAQPEQPILPSHPPVVLSYFVTSHASL